MKTKVVRLGIKREPGRIYWIAQNAVWSKPLGKTPGPGRLEAKTGPIDQGVLYFLDKDGDVSSASRRRVKR